MTKSSSLYRRATRVMVGGVSSPVRAYKAVGGTPLFITRGKGSGVWDADGKKYVDYVCSWGALILGHSNGAVLRAVAKALKNGSSFGAPTEPELELAEAVCRRVPSIEKVRFVNSGTEAAMAALRLARAYTGRDKVVKLDGCYHGHADSFLTKAGSGLATLDLPDSAGVPKDLASKTITAQFNDSSSVERALREHRGEVAAVIVEPVMGNLGVIPPMEGFLGRVRELCDENGALLIFDEVITGFRVSPQGAQGLYHARPDITCLGKIIGGGFPVGAYGAAKELMRLVAPEGPVYQAGTLAGNPVAMTAGLETLSLLDGTAYDRLETSSARLEAGLAGAARRGGIPLQINRVGSMLGLFFSDRRVSSAAEARGSGHGAYAGFFRRMLESGVYLPPSPFESLFVSTAHTDGNVDRTVGAAEAAWGEG